MASNVTDQKVFVVKTLYSSGDCCGEAVPSRYSTYRIVKEFEERKQEMYVMNVGRNINVAHLLVQKKLSVQLRRQ
jgi:hypothetical protein